MQDANKPKRFRDTRKSITISLSVPTYDDMSLYLLQRRELTQEKFTQQQFIETAIMRELARVRGKKPEEIPNAPNYHQLAQQMRRRPNE